VTPQSAIDPDDAKCAKTPEILACHWFPVRQEKVDDVRADKKEEQELVDGNPIP
jgi:hypothetical protein